MLSWLLRHGIKHKSVPYLQQGAKDSHDSGFKHFAGTLPAIAVQVGLNSESADGWVKVTDVLASEYFKEITKEILMKACNTGFVPWHTCCMPDSCRS